MCSRGQCLSCLGFCVSWCFTLRSRCVGGSTSGFLIITRGKTQLLYVMLIILNIPAVVRVPGGWDGTAAKRRLIVKLRAPCGRRPVHTGTATSQTSPKLGWLLSSHLPVIHPNLPESDAATFLPTRRASRNDSAASSSWALPISAPRCHRGKWLPLTRNSQPAHVSVSRRKRTLPTVCSTRVRADKISSHWFFAPLTLAERRILPWYNCAGSLVNRIWAGGRVWAVND